MNFNPLIEGITKLIGHTDPVAVEKFIGPLTRPEKQLPVLHDYLRGASALSEIESTGAPHVRGISRGVWTNTQARLQALIDQDPELGTAIKSLYAGVSKPVEKGVATKIMPQGPEPVQGSVSLPAERAPEQPRAKVPTMRKLASNEQASRAEAVREFMLGTESQDPTRIEAALERIKALHENDIPTPGERLPYERTLDYMSSLEQNMDVLRQQGFRGENWDAAIDDFRAKTDLDPATLPKYLQDAVIRYDAWAKAQKPPSLTDMASQVWNAPRAIQTSYDISAPGRQGITMITQPEYWQQWGHMMNAFNEEKFLESQAWLRNHPDAKEAAEAGLAITDLHNKLAPREEAFKSELAEKIPVLGKGVKASQQAYITFLNRLRMSMFSNHLNAAKALGIDISTPHFRDSLAKWINTGTGRGGGKGFNPGILDQVFYSPRLIASRLETFNPAYYLSLHPYVRQQALKANLGAAALVYSLVSLAALGGAKVTWDFRNTDAGNVRIGNTRYDISGGIFPYMRLIVRLARGETMNPEGKIKELNTGKFGSKDRAQLVLDFMRYKEAPMVSFFHDWLAGKDALGQPFNLPKAAAERMMPLMAADMYKAVRDKGVEGLLYASPEMLGIGYMDYEPRQKTETVPFMGVKGEVPPEFAKSYADAMEKADIVALERAVAKSHGKTLMQKQAIQRAMVRAERTRARKEWILANRDAFIQARLAGQPRVPLQAPEGEAYRP